MTSPDLALAWGELPWGFGAPPAAGVYRAAPDDFQVSEMLPFEPSGVGEHQLLQITKRGLDTMEAVRRLAAFAQVGQRAVGYAGLKDRHALTTQWLSIHLPRREVAWGDFHDPALRIDAAHRHHRKLRVGALRGNRFRIMLREVTGDRQAITARWDAILCRGVPNYFGSQRFGREGANLAAAENLFARCARRRLRYPEKMALSAARSFLFNWALSSRVISGTWDRALAGEVLMLAGVRSAFTLEGAPDTQIAQRVAHFDLTSAGPLWGREGLRPTHDAGAQEEAALAEWPDWRDALERRQKRLDRRPYRLVPGRPQLQWLASDRMQCEFTLPPGGYATTLLRELVAPLGPSPSPEQDV